MPDQKCGGCGLTKPAEEYHKAGNGRRRGDLCASCRRIWNQGRGALRRFLLAKTPEELLEWQRRQLNKKPAPKTEAQTTAVEVLGEEVE